MKNSHIVGGTVILIIVIVVGVNWPFIKKAIAKYSPNKKQDPFGDNTDDAETKGLVTNMVLSNGMYDSPEVKELQRLLNELQPENSLNIDGDFGPLTEGKLYSITGRRQTTLKDIYQLRYSKFK